MCLTCGCMKPNDDHGKADYLTLNQLEASAKLDGLSLNDAIKMLNKTLTDDRRKREARYEAKPKA